MAGQMPVVCRPAAVDPGAWSLELRNFTSKGQQDLSLKSAPAPPFAGFNAQFKEKMALTESRPLPDALLGGSSLTLLENALWTFFSPGVFG